MDSEIVTIATTTSMTEAAAWQVFLESEGYTVFLADLETIKTDWFLANALGSIKLQVPKQEADRALQSLTKKQQEKDDRNDKIENENACLACGADMPEDVSTCPACGWTFATEPEEDAQEKDDDRDSDEDD